MMEQDLFSVSVRSGNGTLIAPHYHEDALEFIEVVKGSADVTVGLDTVRVPEGGIVHLLPGFVHFAVAAEECECFLRVVTYRPKIPFSLDALDERFLSLYLLPVSNRLVLFTDEHPLHASLRVHMENAISEWRGKELFYASLILSEICHMMASVLRFYGYNEEDSQEYRNMMRIEPTVAYIGTSYSQKLRLDELASKLYLSPDHFGKLFRSTIGMTPVDYINNVRVNAAMRYLAATDWGIAEISHASGFTNSNYFHKVFHDLTGVGPAALRKRWRAMKNEEILR